MTVKKVSVVNLRCAFKISAILTLCGKDMYEKYGLLHWKNSYFKTLLIYFYSAIGNGIYVVTDDFGTIVATFQTRLQDDELHFSKLAVLPSYSGKGIGGFCIRKIEELASLSGKKKVVCEVYDKSEHAISFYKNKGYEIVGKTETRKYTELKLEKILGNTADYAALS